MTHATSSATSWRKLLGWQKAANLGGDPEQGFEQSFASTAYSYIQDKAPRLLDHMVGFQLVDRNEDNTKALGLFGFQIGKQWYYSPTFFINGDFKGHELLYVKEQDSFVPMKENWVNYLLSRRPHVLGEPSGENMQELGIRQPDFQTFTTPPNYGKTAMRLRPWAKEAMPLVAKWVTQSPKSMAKYAGLDQRLDLRALLAKNVNLVKAAMDVVQRYPQLGQHIEKFYGTGLFKQALTELRNAVKTAAPSVLGKLEVPVCKAAGILIAPTHVERGVAYVLTHHDMHKVAENPYLYTAEQKEQLAGGGYLVVDNRSDDEVSKAYSTQVEVQLRNPDETGIFEVLTKAGKFERCLILHNPHAGNGRANLVTVVRLGDGRNWINADRTRVWVRDVESRDEFQDWLNEQGERESLADDGLYVALSPTRQGSTPFRVDENLGEGLYEVSFRDYVSYSASRPDYLPTLITVDRSRDGCDQPERVQLGDERLSGFRSLSNTMYIPDNAKILTLKKPRKKDEHGYLCCEESESSNPPIELGDFGDLQKLVTQKTAGLKVVVDHSEVVVNEKRLSKFAGFCHLVTEHGFREDVAKEIMKQAERFGGARFRVIYKQANPFGPMMTGQGIGAPSIPDPNMGQAFGTMGVPSQDPMEMTQAIPEMAASQTDRSMYDPNMVDPSGMQMAQQGGQMGQKEVFDTAMIGSLLKTVQQDSLVDRYLGDLMKALDRLGRILFLFYWHSEEFEDRYGKGDLPELEDTLRNAFEVLGDLVLFLRMKTVEPNMGYSADPDIDNAARN